MQPDFEIGEADSHCTSCVHIKEGRCSMKNDLLVRTKTSYLVEIDQWCTIYTANEERVIEKRIEQKSW